MQNKTTVQFSVEGMTCNGCAQTIENLLKNKPGILFKKISYPDDKAEIIFDAGQITKEELIETINASGDYEVSGEINKDTNGLDRYSLIIIGGGSAAFGAALRTSELGGTALIINKGLPTGGTCVNTGCVPSKTLIRAAETHHRAGHSNFKGIKTESRISDFKTIINQKRQLVEDLRQQKYVDVIKDDLNIQLITAHGNIVDKHRVETDGKIYRAEHILVATGAAPFIPDISGLEEAGYLTNESAYKLEKLPEHLVILGGGYIALENAQLFARLGAKVTIIQRSAQILSDQSDELAQGLAQYLEDEGITILTNTSLKEVSSSGGDKIIRLTVQGEEATVTASAILVATGRQGNTEHLGLENIGLSTERRGYLPVDETLRTSVSNIFAAGDVTGKLQFVYTAAYEGKIAAENAMRGSSQKTDYSVLPWVIFTDPQVAGIGMDEAQAREAGIEYDTAKLTLDNVPRSIAARDTRGYIKLIRNKENDRLVGARILAPEGSELLMELALAIRHKIPVKSLTSEFHPYLTLSESIKLAALTFDKDVKKLSCCAV